MKNEIKVPKVPKQMAISCNPIRMEIRIEILVMSR